MQLLDGKIASAAIKDDLKNKLSGLKAAGKKMPHLAAMLIGSNPASETYIASKVKNCNEIGITSSLLRYNDSIGEKEILQKIKDLNDDIEIDGILVQLPLPEQISEEKVINAISPEKDVDGFHPVNVGKMVLGLPSFISATPLGIILLLQHYSIEIAGRHVVVIGRSNIIGTPASILLSRNTSYGNATVTLCHSKTKNLSEICQQADVIIAAIGKPEFLKASMVKKNAVVIDVGINRIRDETKKAAML